jgi:hypothetical protein
VTLTAVVLVLVYAWIKRLFAKFPDDNDVPTAQILSWWDAGTTTTFSTSLNNATWTYRT